MAKANEEKSGDKLAGIAAETAEERVAAKFVLSNLTLNDLRNNPAVPYEEDEVTRIIQDDVNEQIFNTMKNWTVAEFREWLLDVSTTPEMIRRASKGITSEIVAGVCKLMSNLDLIYAAKKMRVSAHCNTTIFREHSLPVCSRTTQLTIRRVSSLLLWKVFPWAAATQLSV